jgi:precorrin-3B synthase
VPENSSFASRPEADRCPGVLRLTEAADGRLARVRLPGGLIDAAQLRVLAGLADKLGDGRLELTSRGNVQLRGLDPNAAGPLTDALARAGLLPSLSHDQVRNVLASPLAGLDRGPGLTEIVRAFDAALCARPRLAELSGRFLFAIDDGRGDVASLGADVVAAVRTGGAVVNGLTARPASCREERAVGGITADSQDGVVAAMLAFAEAFLDLRAELDSGAWRITDLPDGPERLRALVAARLGLAAAPEEETVATKATRPVGLVTGREGSGVSVVLIAPLGRLTSAQVSWVANRIADRAARITPWRSVVLPGLDDAAGVLDEAAGHGFGTDDRSPWLRVTACAGRPGCASALADVQADAAGFAAHWPGRLVHVSGCSRHCGRPAATEIDVTATSEGYQVAGI